MRLLDISGRPIFLVGMMGAGKSTVGRLLAAHLSREFVDVDERVEAEAQATVAELFASEGEAAFRARERDVLLRLCDGERVISTGGGLVAQGDNLDRMLAAGVVIALNATPQEILRRIGDLSSRPLLARASDPRAELERLLGERQRFYQRSQLHIDTDGKAPSQVVAQIREALSC